MINVKTTQLNAERATLGALLLSSRRFPKVRAIVTGESFSLESHRMIFWAIEDLYNRDLPVDVVTVTEWCEERAAFHDAAECIPRLASDTPSAAHAEKYARIMTSKNHLKLVES